MNNLIASSLVLIGLCIGLYAGYLYGRYSAFKQAADMVRKNMNEYMHP